MVSSTLSRLSASVALAGSMAFAAEPINSRMLRKKNAVSLSRKKRTSPAKKQPAPTREVKASRRGNGFGMCSIKMPSLKNLESDLLPKTKSEFLSDSSLEKMLYLASQNAAKKWTQRCRS